MINYFSTFKFAGPYNETFVIYYKDIYSFSYKEYQNEYSVSKNKYSINLQVSGMEELLVAMNEEEFKQFQEEFEQWKEIAHKLTVEGKLTHTFDMDIKKDIENSFKEETNKILEELSAKCKLVVEHSSSTINQLNNFHFESVKAIETSLKNEVLPTLKHVSEVANNIIIASDKVSKFLE